MVTEARTMTVAREIAKQLMTNTLGERCDRLAQLHQGFPIGGGWSLDGAAEQIAEVLENEGYIIDRIAEAQRRSTQALEALSRCVFHKDKPPARACRECSARTALVAQVVAVFDAVQPPPPVGSPTTEKPRCRVCGGSGFIAQKQTIDDGYGEVDMCVYCEQEGKSTPVEPAGANEPRPQACENGDCRDHFGDELAWCVKCAPVSPVEPTPEPPQDGGNPK